MRAIRCASLIALGALFAPPALGLEIAALSKGPVEAGTSVKLAVKVTDGVGQVSVGWNFGDGQLLAPEPGAATVTHTYVKAGHYTVIVTVKDSATSRGTSFLQTVHWPLTETSPVRSSSIVYDTKKNLVYVTNPDNASIGILSGETYSLLKEVPTFQKPTTLALAPNGRVWVAHQDDFVIALVDPDTGELVNVIPLPYASQPTGIAFSPAGDVAYVSLRALGKIVKLDAKTRAVLETFDVNRAPQALAVTGDGARVFATRFFSPLDHGELSELGGATQFLVRDPGPDTDTSGRGVPNFVSAVTLTPDGRSAWVAAKKDNTERGIYLDGLEPTPENSVRSLIARIDLAANSEVLAERIDVDNRNLPAAICFSEIGDYAFVSTQGNDRVVVIDAYSGSTVATVDETGKAPSGVVLSPDGRLFVQAFLSRSVSVFDVSNILSAHDFAEPTKLGEIPSVASDPTPPSVLTGKQIFYDSSDPRMAREGYLSCATCHIDGMEDGRVWDFTNRGEGLRNTSALLGRRGTGHGRLHWTANFDEIQDFEHDIRNAFGGTGFLSDEDFHTGTRDQTLGDPKTGLSPELDALAAYVSSLDHVNASPFRDPDGTLSETALAGKKHFLALACDACHEGPDFTDSAEGELHDVGTLTPASGQRLGQPLTGLDTPTLLGLWETAPYLHDGSAATVHDVLVTRNPNGLHGATDSLTETELLELEAYLLELDSELPIRELPVFSDDPEPSPETATEGTAAGGGCGCVVGSRHDSGWAWLAVVLGLAFVRKFRG
jgi:MYXO-CTERM domain-containing protein